MFKLKIKSPLVLASASPRRSELISSLGINFEILPVDLDETQLPGEKAEVLVERLALAKAKACLQAPEGAWIIGADTVVSKGEQVYGKPEGIEDARAILEALSGSTHFVYGGLAIVNSKSGVEHVSSSVTEVKMRKIESDEIDSYIESGECFGKAGAYAIQGLASAFVTSINGSYSNVVGLDLCLFISTLKSLELV